MGNRIGERISMCHVLYFLVFKPINILSRKKEKKKKERNAVKNKKERYTFKNEKERSEWLSTRVSGDRTGDRSLSFSPVGGYLFSFFFSHSPSLVLVCFSTTPLMPYT